MYVQLVLFSRIFSRDRGYFLIVLFKSNRLLYAVIEYGFQCNRGIGFLILI